MIKSLHIKNFRCVYDLVLPFNFSEGKAPNGYKDSDTWPFIQVARGVDARVCPVLALYGANASGKTTILMALGILTQAVIKGWFEGLYQPNLICTDQRKVTSSTFSIEFWVTQHLYRYELEIGRYGFSSEKLSVDNKVLYCVQNATIESLDGFKEENRADLAKSFQLRCVNAKTNYQVQTFLNETAQAFPGMSRDLLEAKDYLQSQIVAIKGEVPFVVGIKLLAETFTGSNEQKEQQAIDMILGYLHKLDIPIIGMRLEEGDSSEILRKLPEDHPAQSLAQQGSFYTLQTAHKNQFNQEVWFNISKESEGTRRLIGLLGYLLAAIKKGKTVCIDEIDDSLHSLLVIELIRLFKTKRINENNAQLIVTIHNTDLLAADLLGLSEVGIVTLRGCEGSKLIRLVDIPGLRNADNFRRRYLRGEFGGIPFPYV